MEIPPKICIPCSWQNIDCFVGSLTNNLYLYQRCIAGNIGGNISAVLIVNTYIA